MFFANAYLRYGVVFCPPHAPQAYALRPAAGRKMSAPSAAVPVGGTATPQLDEVTGCAWVPLAKVPDLDTPPELPALIESAAQYARTLG
jgi:hypothetical protein